MDCDRYRCPRESGAGSFHGDFRARAVQRPQPDIRFRRRCAGEELVCLDSTGRPFKVVDGPVQNGCLGEAYPGGTAVPFPEESGDTRINVSGNQASLYFECHDIGDYELPTRFIAPDTFLAGTGISSPLSRQVPHSGRCASFCEQPALDRTPS